MGDPQRSGRGHTLLTLSERSESKGCRYRDEPFDSALARLAQGEKRPVV